MSASLETPGAERAINYEAAWKSWGDLPFHSPTAIHTRRLILSEARRLSFGTVLEVGCGLGILLGQMRERFPAASYSGADVAANVIERARALQPGVRFEVADCSREAPAGHYDLILLSEVIEHLEHPLRAAENLRRACSGHLILTTPTGPRLGTDRAFGHLRHFTPDELRDLLQAAGFEVVRSYRWGWPFQVALRRLLNVRPDRARASFVDGGRYGPGKRLIARLWSALFHLNVKGLGTQLIVVARAR